MMLLLKSLTSIKKIIVITFKVIYLCFYYVIIAPIKILFICIK